MTVPDYEDLYERLMQTPVAQEIWRDVTEIVRGITLTALRPVEGTNWKTEAIVDLRVPTIGALRGYGRAMLRDNSDHWYVIRREDMSMLVDEHRIIHEIVEPHLGKDVERRFCRKKIVLHGAARTLPFHAWIGKRIATEVKTAVTRRLNGPDETEVFAGWDLAMRDIWKERIKRALKNLTKGAPTDMLQEAFDEFIVANTMES